MPRNDDIQHSILIVSGSEAFEDAVKKQLPAGRFMTVDVRKSAASARRYLLERFYDMIVINAPMPDENGMGFAMDAAGQSRASILIALPRELYEDMAGRASDNGILVLPKPFPLSQLSLDLRYMMGVQKKVKALEAEITQAEEKAEEQRIVSRAKLILIEKKGMTEADAHHLILKEAMDNGISRRRAAEKIIEDAE